MIKNDGKEGKETHMRSGCCCLFQWLMGALTIVGLLIVWHGHPIIGLTLTGVGVGVPVFEFQA